MFKRVMLRRLHRLVFHLITTQELVPSPMYKTGLGLYGVEVLGLGLVRFYQVYSGYVQVLGRTRESILLAPCATMIARRLCFWLGG